MKKITVIVEGVGRTIIEVTDKATPKSENQCIKSALRGHHLSYGTCHRVFVRDEKNHERICRVVVGDRGSVIDIY